MLCAVTIGPWTFDNCLISIASDAEWRSEVHVLRNGPGWACKLPHPGAQEQTSCIVTCSNTTDAEKAKRMHQGNYTSWNRRKGKMRRKSITWQFNTACILWFINSGLDQFRSGTPAKNSLNVVESNVCNNNMYERYTLIVCLSFTKVKCIKTRDFTASKCIFFNYRLTFGWGLSLRTLISGGTIIMIHFPPFLVSLSASSGPQRQKTSGGSIQNPHSPSVSNPSFTGIIHPLEHQALVHRPA